jgi:hypothetical protein
MRYKNAVHTYRQRASKKGRLLLAIQAIHKGQIKSVRAAATIYNIARSTLQERLAGVLSRDIFILPNRKLKLSEEESLPI